MSDQDKSFASDPMQKAGTIAQKMLDGEISIYDGVDEIAMISEANNFPDALIDIYHLAHLKDDHEHIGINRENVREDIIAEAKKLIM